MATKPLPPQSVLLQLLRYDPDTGKLFWRERPVDMFPAVTPARSKSLCALWNKRYACAEAFTTISDGYRIGSIGASNFKAHRVIWKMVTGKDADQIDHINGERCDNRWENLRDVSLIENTRNRAVPKNNRSGVIGVYHWTNGVTSYWVAQVGGKKSLYLNTLEEAVAARKAAQPNLGFHENHGRAS